MRVLVVEDEDVMAEALADLINRLHQHGEIDFLDHTADGSHVRGEDEYVAVVGPSGT